MSHSFRESTGVLNLPQVPSYMISRRIDLSFEWKPPLGSRELANALGMKYPFEASLEKQMQRALLEFIESEERDKKKGRSAQYHSSSQPPSPSRTTSTSPVSVRPKHSEIFASSMNTWNVTTGEPVERKVRRASYDGKKRRKVAEVRRYGACDFHRKQKTECTCLSKSPVQRRLSTVDLKNTTTQHDSTPMGDLPTPAATTPFPTPEEQNTLNITPSTSPSERKPTRPFSFVSQSPEFESPALRSTDQSQFWNTSPYLDSFATHQLDSSTDTNTVTSITSWEPPPIDHDLENWWASQGV